MRLENSKVASFSLVEMLVVLVLSGIVLSALYFSYYTVFANQITFTRKIGRQEELGTLFYSLKRDVELSYVLRVHEEQSMDCFTSPNEVGVSYHFFSSHTIRRQFERIDTFHCKIKNISFRFQGIPVSNSSDVIDEIVLTEDAFQSPFEMDIYKLYDAASLIDATPNDTTRERN
jgi:prepilin-type N-terminal cleavage/methylation domain-containing protein